jgi:hypothetical protein
MSFGIHCTEPLAPLARRPDNDRKGETPLPERIVSGYYWLTPLFWALDALFGWNVRAAALEGHSGWKALYYLLCLGLGALLWARPELTRLVGIAESSLNLTLLVLGMLVPYFQLIDRIPAGDFPRPGEFTVEKSLGFLVAGLAWWVSFQLHLRRRRRFPHPAI